MLCTPSKPYTGPKARAVPPQSLSPGGSLHSVNILALIHILVPSFYRGGTTKKSRTQKPQNVVFYSRNEFSSPQKHLSSEGRSLLLQICKAVEGGDSLKGLGRPSRNGGLRRWSFSCPPSPSSITPTLRPLPRSVRRRVYRISPTNNVSQTLHSRALLCHHALR